MHRFLIVIEKANGNYSAYSPDLPGCIATGTTRKKAEKNMHEAIEMHLQGIREDGLSIPQSTAIAEYVAVK
ncbi:MAG: type II toxin-antitoxin system HicB family antitoxin [bacterium]|nr:type II toxin-antitoxin system HicB family antitoxin [bacterium]PIP13226.1 MAG: hypothetical protein COX48_04845 [bacterium (Candidatus Stahlbacteria) CG23_combo_of_CG06-09_8_20_14_all_34_7]